MKQEFRLSTLATRIRFRVQHRPTPQCGRCGAALVPIKRMKYDPFWLTLLFCLAAALAFYLIGAVILAVALWLWSRKTSRLTCLACARDLVPDESKGEV